MHRELPPSEQSKPAPSASGKAALRTARFVGLRNQGATCYLNSLVQALYMTPEIRLAVLAFAKSAGAAGPLTRALSDIFTQLAT